MDNKINFKETITFSGLLSLIYMTLKLTGHITWSWWWIPLPLLILLIMVMIINLFAISLKK